MTEAPARIVVVHGGAGTVAPELYDAAVAGTRRAAQAAWAALERGGRCEDAAHDAVRIMEDDPAFNAGRGACMTREGTFEMDAGIMRSRDLASGAVAAMGPVRDAITCARAVMDQSPHALLAGPAADAFAERNGIGIRGRDAVWSEKAQRRYEAALAGTMPVDGRADTVGAVVRDRHGDLCAANSTGGVLLKWPGRVGDTPLCGSGFYAHPELGAACATGVGEAILTHVAAYAALIAARTQAAVDAAAGVCATVAAGGATCGIILVDRDGHVGVAHRSDHMSWAIVRDGADPQSGLGRP